MKHLQYLALASFLPLVGASTLSCVAMSPYRPYERATSGEDADALYRAAIRVLGRKGWHVMVADPVLREVRTRWFAFRDLGLSTAGADGPEYAGSFRVTIRNDSVEVFTACDWMNDLDRLRRYQACPDGQRPDGLHDREVELASEIVDEARNSSADLGPSDSMQWHSAMSPPPPPAPPPPAPPLPLPPPPAPAPAAPPPPPAPPPASAASAGPPAPAPGPAPAASQSPTASVAGCSTDAECKGDRICVYGGCVEPPQPLKISLPGW
jgi:hypothetical protein